MDKIQSQNRRQNYDMATQSICVAIPYINENVTLFVTDANLGVLCIKTRYNFGKFYMASKILPPSLMKTVGLRHTAA